jgi:hypothetical protein
LVDSFEEFGAPDDERYAARNMLSLQKILEYEILLQGCIFLVISADSYKRLYAFVGFITISQNSIT